MAILLIYLYPQLFFKSTELSAQAMALAKALAMTSTIHNDILYTFLQCMRETSVLLLGGNLAAWGALSCLKIYSNCTKVPGNTLIGNNLILALQRAGRFNVFPSLPSLTSMILQRLLLRDRGIPLKVMGRRSGLLARKIVQLLKSHLHPHGATDTWPNLSPTLKETVQGS